MNIVSTDKNGGAYMDILELIEAYGEPYSEMLGIDLRKGDLAYARWFLASILYAKPIREESATKTYKTFEAAGLTDARSIVEAGWDRLVALLDRGGYTRYDYSTADRLLEVFGNLLKDYGGSLQRLYDASRDGEDLEHRLRRLGKGIGPATISIFLRDMQSVWPKASPKPTAREKEAASALGIKDIKKYTKKHGLSPVKVATTLHRYSRTIKRQDSI